jgi:hypothetical protein
MTPLYHRYHIFNKQRVKMSELSCGTRFIGRNETLDLSLYQKDLLILSLESTLRALE